LTVVICPLLQGIRIANVMTEEKSLKNQAEQIMTSLSQDLRQTAESATPETLAKVDRRADAVMNTIFGIVSDVDIQAATERVKALRKQHPAASPAELVQVLIRNKTQRTGMVGAVTSGAGLLPGVGTAAALVLGVAADIGATFKLQAELVLEIAAVYDYPLSEEEKQRIVMLITGLSAGTTALARRAGEAATVRLGEKFATKSLVKALPVVGVLASAGTNVLSTYVIGQRADAYFRLGPSAVGSWTDSLRAVSGVDERKIMDWLAESGKATGTTLASGASKVGQAGKAAGERVVTQAGKVAETAGPILASGARKAGKTAQTGVNAYIRWLVTFWTAVVHFIAIVVRLVWLVVSFIPRKIIRLFRGKKNNKPDGL
jgi:hypothetical protein